MIISKNTLEKIKKIIDSNYKNLVAILSNKDRSLLSLVYYNNVLNDPTSTVGPLSITEMAAQQKTRPDEESQKIIEEHLDENFAQLIEQLKAKSQTGIEGLIREYNLVSRNKALTEEEQLEDIRGLMAQSSVGGLKRKLRDYFGDAGRDWEKVAITETANALGMGSVDRIVAHNKGKDLSGIMVYRVAVKDNATCKFCKRFYEDSDGSPVVYRLSTILSNGSNYGKKAVDWLPTALSTHPNERCSGLLELKPGWKLLPDGKVEFIGYENWPEYISGKLRG